MYDKIMQKYGKVIGYSFAILMILGMIIGNIGGTISEGTPMEIIEVKDKTFIVDGGEKNGDKIIYEIKKPLFKDIREGKEVNITVTRNNKARIAYNIDLENIGFWLCMGSTVLIFAVFLLAGFVELLVLSKTSVTARLFLLILLSLGVGVYVAFNNNPLLALILICFVPLILIVIIAIVTIISHKKNNKK